MDLLELWWTETDLAFAAVTLLYAALVEAFCFYVTRDFL